MYSCILYHKLGGCIIILNKTLEQTTIIFILQKKKIGEILILLRSETSEKNPFSYNKDFQDHFKSCILKHLHYFFLVLDVFSSLYSRMYVELKAQPVEVSFLLLPCRFQAHNSEHQAGQQSTLTTEAFHSH